MWNEGVEWLSDVEYGVSGYVAEDLAGEVVVGYAVYA